MYTIEVNGKKEHIQPHKVEVFEDTYKLVYTTLYKGHRVQDSVKLKDIESWNDEIVEEIVNYPTTKVVGLTALC